MEYKVAGFQAHLAIWVVGDGFLVQKRPKVERMYEKNTGKPKREGSFRSRRIRF